MIVELFPPRISEAQPGKLFRGEPEYIREESLGNGFRIEAEPEHCQVRGGRTGLLYAADLLAELKARNGGVPCAEYSDTPDLAFRCYHMDLKKGSGGLPDLKRTLKRLRELRYNYVLIEYENRIKLDSLPGIEAPDAFSHEEIRELNAYAKENGIRVIPLLQSFGHLEYLLKHPDYQKYSELPDDFQQLCPLKDEAFELWKKVFDEMRSLHPDTDYFHIGGDEAYNLGKCPKCAEYAKKHSPGELFFHHIERVCRYAADHGCRPILWHDMLAQAGRYDLLGRLPEETVLLYWDYRSREQDTNHVMLTKKYLVSREWIGKVHSFPDFAAAPEMFTGFIEDEEPESLERIRAGATERGLTEFAPLPMLGPLKGTGRTVYGASSLGYSPCATLLGNTGRSYSNMRMWLDQGVDGIVVTRWAANNSLDAARGPASLRDFQLMLSAEMMWDRKLDLKEISGRYDRSFGPQAGCISGMLDMVVYSELEMFFNWPEHIVPEFAALEEKIDPQLLWLYRKYRAAMNAELLIRRIRSFMRNGAGKMAGSASIGKYRQEIQAMKTELREMFSDEFPPESMDQWLLRLFEPYDAMFAGLELQQNRPE